MFTLDLVGDPSGSIALATPLSATGSSASTWAPTGPFPGYTFDGTDLSIPLAVLNGLTATAAAASTGDAREVARALCSTLFEWYNELTTKPEAAVLELRAKSFPTTGDFAGKQPLEYKSTFYTTYPESTVVAEPTS